MRTVALHLSFCYVTLKSVLTGLGSRIYA